MLKSIDALFISTTDVKRLADFYTILGIPLSVNDHGDGEHAEADIGNIHFAIQPWKASERPTGNISFSFHVPNLEEYCKDIETKGIQLSKRPAPRSFGGVIAEVVDPDGNLILLNRWQTKEEFAKNFPSN